MLIEYWFVKSGMYAQHWWKYYMTAVAVVLFLAIVKKWFIIMNRERHGLPRFITFYLVFFVVIHISFPLLLLLGKQHYSVDFAQNMYRSSTLFILLYHLIETFLVTMLLLLDTWYGKMVPFVISFAGQASLANSNILIFEDGWKLFYTILVYAISITICILIEKYTLRPQ